ncbi:MAG: transporter ATP-binding protein, partial [Paenibacillaceae bacterium]|nr:transporter ATP-binding protein [Paenibacillaceae bacterium]
LVKVYGEFRLGPVSMTLEQGFVYVMMGRNGSGKTTLFRLLNAISQPEEGTMEWFPDTTASGVRDSTALGIAALRDKRCRIAYMPDELDIPDDGWSLREWRDIVSLFFPAWDEDCYRRLVARYSLNERKSMHKSSKGTKKLAAFVIALAQAPQVLILDEPSAGLDPFAWKMMLEDLSAFMSSGDRTILMATHIVEEIRRLGDYLLFLEDGKVHGPFEKDSLAESWRTLWINELPQAAEALPGVAAVEKGAAARVVSRSPQETRAALEKLGLTITDERPLDWDELFWHVVRNKDKTIRRGE